MQEAVLSRRRLFFTKDQAYFEYYRMHQGEVIEYKQEAIDQNTAYKGPSMLNCVKSDLKRSTASLRRLLSTYRTREMTYAANALPAFLGILARYTKDSQALKHYFGLSFLDRPESTTLEDEKRKSFMVSGFVKTLAWQAEYGTRRRDFPSWT